MRKLTIPPIEELPDLLTLHEVAEIIRVSPITLKRWEKKGKITFIRINSRGDRRLRKTVLYKFLNII